MVVDRAQRNIYIKHDKVREILVETIEAMFSRFQTLVSDLHVLNKSYIVHDHVKKILRSLTPK